MVEHVIELIPEYALGCLEKDEKEKVRFHLASCALCQGEFLHYQRIVDELAEAAPQVEPPVGIREAILGRTAAGARQRMPQKAVEKSQGFRLPTIFGNLSPAWGALSVFLIVLLTATNLIQWMGAPRNKPTASPAMMVVRLEGTDFSPAAKGIIVISANGEYGTLVVDGLPLLASEKQYQLWLIQDGKRENGGVFSVGSEGYTSLVIYSPEALSHYSSYGITIEPYGGSPGPTGDKVLGGSL